jgi:hypothetical protein
MKKRAPQIESINPPKFIEPTIQSYLHLNRLGGRENYKVDHLDKTKDLSATPAGKSSRALVLDLWSAHAGNAPYIRQSQTLLPTRPLTAHIAHIFPRTIPLELATRLCPAETPRPQESSAAAP